MVTLFPTTENVSGVDLGVSLAHGPWLTLVYGVLYSPLWVMILGGNTLVIVAFASKKTLHKPTNYFLVSLAVTDLLTGLVSMPVLITGRLVESPFTCISTTRCYFFIPTMITSSLSAWHLSFIVVDRLISVYKPLHYPSVVTAFRVKVVLAIIWIYTFLFGILPVTHFDGSEPEWICGVKAYHGYGKEQLIACVIFIPVYLVVMITLYGVMIRKVANHMKTHHELTNRQQRQVQTQRRGLATMALVVGAFGLCYFPSCFQFVYELLFEYSDKLIIVQTICEYPVFINSMVNPIIYAVRKNDFNQSMKECLSKLIGGKKLNDRSKRPNNQMTPQDQEESISTKMTKLSTVSYTTSHI